MCVPLFFIVSAYTLALSYNSRIQKENYPTKKFFMRRFFRIYPLFFTMSIFLFLLYNSPIVIFAENTTIDTSIGNLIKHLTFTYGFSLESL
jgi:peptidoglycan/LPS O-acetylase OafA/YrhL